MPIEGFWLGFVFSLPPLIWKRKLRCFLSTSGSKSSSCSCCPASSGSPRPYLLLLPQQGPPLAGSDPTSRRRLLGLRPPCESLLEKVLCSRYRSIRMQLCEVFNPKILEVISVCVMVHVLFLFQMLFLP